jgi:hypothetical protein
MPPPLPRKASPVPIEKKSGWAQSWSGHGGKKKNSSPHAGNWILVARPVAIRYTDWAIAAYKITL